MTEYVVLVDEQDVEAGVMLKLEAHERGLLHRAISVFVFNSKGEMLLQKRAEGKYHSAGLWSNACCSHPRPGEEVHAAAIRRLKEEMGLTCSLNEAFSFVYKAGFDNGLTEYEYDHVYVGFTDHEPVPDPAEVAGWSYVDIGTLDMMLANAPGRYSEWFRICLRDYRDLLVRHNNKRDEGI